MDKISVTLSLRQVEEQWRDQVGEFTVEQHISVNGNRFTGYCELLAFFRDRHRVSHYDPNASWSYLDSCSCGAPGCAGIWEGVYIKKHKGVYYYGCRKRGGYTKGLLGSGKRGLRVSEENILQIRDHIRSFYLDNKQALEGDYESQGIIGYLKLLTTTTIKRNSMSNKAFFAARLGQAGAVIRYEYWKDNKRGKSSGVFEFNLMTGKVSLVKVCSDDILRYAFARIQLQITRLVELQGKYPEEVYFPAEDA